LLDDQGRVIVERVTREHAAIRGWDIHAINVRTNHVHVVVNCKGTHTPEVAMQQFKSWATRRLVEAGLADKGQDLWTDHGSTRYLNDATSLMSAIEYVQNRQ
jgi:REP element-mobilizing transposase RayT